MFQSVFLYVSLAMTIALTDVMVVVNAAEHNNDPSSSMVWMGPNANTQTQKEDHQSQRSLASMEETCQTIRDNIPDTNILAPIKDKCKCSQDSSTGDVMLSCQVNKACISSEGGDLMKGGTFSAIFVQSGDGPSYTRTLTSTSCFTYPNDIYLGNKVCVTTIDDSMGTNSQCEIKVGENSDQQCSVCRFCPVHLISFDCTNIGFEDKSGCDDNNENNTILQFLHNSSIDLGCSGTVSGGNGGGGGGGGSSSSSASASGLSSPTTATSVGFAATMFLAFIGSLFSIILM